MLSLSLEKLFTCGVIRSYNYRDSTAVSWLMGDDSTQLRPHLHVVNDHEPRDLLENELAAAAAPAAPHFLDEICTFLAEFRPFHGHRLVIFSDCQNDPLLVTS